MKNLFLLACTSLTLAFSAFSQSDNCATATVINVNGNTCVNGTTVNATSSNTMYGACNAAPVNEVWYTYVTQGTQNDFQINPGTLQDAEIVIYTGGCPPTGLLELCDNAAGGASLNTGWGLPPGTQVWVGVMSSTNTQGTFQLCIDSYTPPATGGNACSGALPICQGTINVDMNNMSSSATFPSCFGGAVNQDVWFTFDVLQSGTFEWSATPAGTSTGVELDWALYDITGGCPGTEIDCNYNFDFGGNNPAGQTPGGTGEFNPPSNLIAGNTYAIVVDFFSSGTTGTLDFSVDGGSALIAPNADFTINPTGVTCASNLNVTINDLSVGAPDWDFGDGTTFTGNNPPAHTYNTPGTYAITASFGGACPSTHTEFVQLFGPIVLNESGIDETCPGDCDGEATVATSGGSGVYNYSWAPGGQTTPTITGLCPGNYTVTVSDPTCGTNTPATVTVGTGSCCSMTDLTINVTNCYVNGGFLEYDIAGVLTFTNPPTTGQLVITDCYGATQTFNAPFVSPFNFTQTNMPQTGAQCDFTAVFTDDPTCTIVGPHQAPPPITGFSSNCVIGAGIVTGDITFDDTYGSGFLVVSIDDGTNVLDTMITLPTTSPQNWSVSGLNPAANPYTISYYFSDYPGCSQTTTINCGCQADAGTYNVSMTGNGNTNFILCDGDQVDITTNNDFIDPDNNGPLGGFPYDPGIAWLIYNCPPTPGVDPNNDPCFQGIFNAPNGSGNMSDINDLGIINAFPPGTFNNNEVFYIPMTMYNYPNLLYNANCWSMGTPVSVTYLTPITFNAVEDCPNGSVTVTLNGGHPEIFGTNFTASNLLPATASFANTTAAHGGTITITGLQDGDMYSFDVVDQNGCPIQVTGGPFVGPPDATINPAGPFCPNDPALNLTAATPGGNWTGTGITNGGAGTFDPATAGAGTHTITYTVGGACPSTDTEDIVVNAAFDATITPAGPFCEDDAAVNLTAADPGGTWAGTGITDVNAGTFDPATAGPGNHIITYTIPGSCGDTDTETIVVNALDDATITPAGPFCDTDPAVNLVAATAGGNWTGTGITNGGAGTFDPATAGQGTHTITYTTNGACPSTDTEDIVVTNQLDATITPAGPFCESNASTILAAVDPGGTWSGTGIINTTTGEFDPATAGPGTHTITYTLGGSCGAVDTEDIVVIADDDATITPAGPFCDTDPAFIMTAADPNGVWSATCGACINAATGSFDPATAGAGTHTITYTIAGACGDTDTENVVVNGQLDATITPAGPFCENDPVFFMSAVDPGGTWSATCGACIDQTTGGFNPAIAGVGLHTITYTIAGACGDVQTTDVDVLPNANAAITPVGPYCIGNPSVILTAVDAGGTWSGIGIIDPATGEFDPTVAGPGTHVITYTIAGQCGNSETTTITVNDPLSVTAFIDMDICEGQNANLSAVANGGDGNYTYTWTDDQGNPAGVGQFITVTPAVTTTYTVSVTDGCGSNAATDQVTVTVNPLPTIDFVVDNATGCAPLTVTFTDNSVPAGTTCLWDFGDTFFSTDCGTTTHTYTDPGCYDVSLTITTAAGCSNSMTQTNMVCVSDNAVADFSFTPDSTTIFDPHFEFTNHSQNADSYLWTFGDGANSTDVDPSHTYEANPFVHEVCLIAYTVDGCNDTICKPVTINDEFLIYVPNAFTPDDDLFNNDFGPVISGHIPESYEFYIFDRWGLIIFESHNLNVRWNGTDPSGVLAKTDVYVWKIKVKSAITGEEKEYVGHVTLLK